MRATQHFAPLFVAALLIPCHSIAENSTPSVADSSALELVRLHNCFTCHAINKKIIGPAWKDVAIRYRGDSNAEDQLVNKVSHGGKGVWGKENAMPAFASHVKEADIRAIVKYILSLK